MHGSGFSRDTSGKENCLIYLQDIEQGKRKKGHSYEWPFCYKFGDDLLSHRVWQYHWRRRA